MIYPCIACHAPVTAEMPMAPVLCPSCAFWRGAHASQLVIPSRDLDQNVYWVDLSDATEPVGAHVRVRYFADGHTTALPLLRLRCLGLIGECTVEGLTPNALLIPAAA